MNCVNCGSRVTNNGCLCTPVGVDTDLKLYILRKLERSNDARIVAQAEIESLKKRLEPIFDIWGRWKDYQRTSYPTVEQTHHALYDFGKAIEKSMTGYNPAAETEPAKGE